MTIKKLKHPGARITLVYRLEVLSDKTRLLNEWPVEGSIKGFWWSMRFFTESLFDDLLLLELPENQVGYTLRDKNELEAVCKVVTSLKKLVQEVGEKKLDTDYIESPLLDELVDAAAVAYPLLKANDEEYGVE